MEGPEPPLHAAVETGDVDRVRRLLNAKADVHMKSRGETTALHDAAMRGSVATIQLLLDYGADAMATEVQGYTPLLVASMYGNAAAVRLFVASGGDVADSGDCSGGATPLHLASAGGHNATVQALLELGAGVDSLDGDYSTPLVSAVEGGRLAVARLLIEHKADPTSARSGGGETALAVALTTQHREESNCILQINAYGPGEKAKQKCLLGRRPRSACQRYTSAKIRG